MYEPNISRCVFIYQYIYICSSVGFASVHWYSCIVLPNICNICMYIQPILHRLIATCIQNWPQCFKARLLVFQNQLLLLICLFVNKRICIQMQNCVERHLINASFEYVGIFEFKYLDMSCSEWENGVS